MSRRAQVGEAKFRTHFKYFEKKKKKTLRHFNNFSPFVEIAQSWGFIF